MPRANKYRVSVVIPSYNDATYIDRLLDALTRQTFDSFEVIVSDAGSHDGTDEVVKKFAKKLAVKLVVSPPEGPGAGRNVGASKAQGEWLLFLDADVDLPDPNFMKTMISVAEARGWQTATPKTCVRDATLAERFGNWANYQYTKLLAHTKHPVAAGWCILTMRGLFESNNGFNPKIQFGEDYDYVTRVGRGSFGYVEDTYFIMDLRRSREEGWRFVYKGIANEVYRHTHGYNLERNPIKYEFGKHNKRK